MTNKKAYYQGGGGVNEPTPGQKKYKSDPALVVQPRFKEPFYRNYDLYKIPGMEDIGPGTGYHGLQNYKSVQEFLKDRRERMKPRYVADDSWQIDNGNRTKKNPERKARMDVFRQIIKLAGPNYDLGKGLYQEMSDGKVDSVEEFRNETDHGPSALMNVKKKKNNKYDVNHIDFPIDDEVNQDGVMIYPTEESYHNPRLIGPSGTGNLATFPGDVGGTDESSYINSTQIAGEHSYLPLPDQDDKGDETLDFGRDYNDEPGPARDMGDDSLEKLYDKYLTPAESELFGLPDGIDPNSDLDAEQTMGVEDPFTGTSDIGTGIYGDKWNI